MVPRMPLLYLLAGCLLAAGCLTDSTPRTEQVRITPESGTLQPGGQITLVAEALDGQGHPLPGRKARWSSRTPAIATVGATTGTVTALTRGTADIVAVIDSVTGIAVLTVAYSPQVRSLRIEPESVALITGQDRLLTATPLDSEGNPIPRQVFDWQSTAEEVATVTQTGLVTAVGAGRATITARIDDQAASALIDVSSRGATVRLEGRSRLDLVSDTVQLTATVLDREGNVISGWPVTWSSSDPAVVRVSTSGKASSEGLGTAVITATSETAVSVLEMTVTRFAVAKVSILPGIVTLLKIGVVPLTAIAVSADGLTLKRAVTWASTNPAVASVSTAGVVSGVALGTTVITGVVEGIEARLPLEVVQSNGSFLTLGAWHTCSGAGSGEVRCWGAAPAAGSAHEVCYDVTYYDYPFNCIRRPTPVGGGAQLVSVVAGEWHTCGLSPSNTAWCWGHNSVLELGGHGLLSSEVPVPVTGGHFFVSLTAGYAFTCGLKPGGEAWCWGRNNNGQLGNGTVLQQGGALPAPVQGGHAFVELTAGDEHVCGLTTLSKVYCWGSNGHGRLGDGSVANRWLPTPVMTAETFVAVDAGGTHTCGVTLAGAGYCWGEGYGGTLGNGDSGDRLTPVSIFGGHQWLSLSAGGSGSCGVRIDGTAWCWGNNWHGMVGDGALGARSIPVRVTGSVLFTEIRMGSYHTCGRAQNGAVYCWGQGMTGALGLGSDVADRLSPALVLGAP